MPRIFLSLVVAVVFVMAGCSDPVSVQSDDSSSNDFAMDQTDAAAFASKGGNAPSESGQVSRFENNVFVRYYDEKRDVHVVVGMDIIDGCQNGLSPEAVQVQQVNDPNELLRYHQRFSGKVSASAWAGPLFGCAGYLSETPLVETSVNFRYTDNDVTAGPNPGNNTNAYGYMFNGKGLNGHARCNWDGVDVATVSCNVNIQVK